MAVIPATAEVPGTSASEVLVCRESLSRRREIIPEPVSDLCRLPHRSMPTPFEDMGVQLLKQSINDAKAGRIKLVLLDEIGGHELGCDEFREILYQLLESDIPCIGVIKLNENAKRMARKNPKIAESFHL